ncbi:hypothetical protein SB724_20350, partial [Bacillus sp. SIMBA_031]|uniref:hypothetical protein n=1 Tax=Bacillus sp. SIMBA_031 TaxID=3085774 RepID=UPI00397965E9
GLADCLGGDAQLLGHGLLLAADARRQQVKDAPFRRAAVLHDVPKEPQDGLGLRRQRREGTVHCYGNPLFSVPQAVNSAAGIHQAMA